MANGHSESRFDNHLTLRRRHLHRRRAHVGRHEVVRKMNREPTWQETESAIACAAFGPRDIPLAELFPAYDPDDAFDGADEEKIDD